MLKMDKLVIMIRCNFLMLFMLYFGMRFIVNYEIGSNRMFVLIFI